MPVTVILDAPDALHTSDPSSGGYQPFPADARRDVLQGMLEIPALVTLLGLPKGKRVLEVGCERGNALPYLQRYCAPRLLVGLDIDPAALAQAASTAREAGIDMELVCGDVRRMEFPDASFDIVLDFGTCYHIDAPERAIREIARVLAPGGLFVTGSRLCQRLAHPERASGERLPWRAAPDLLLTRHAGLWSLSTKRQGYGPGGTGAPDGQC